MLDISAQSAIISTVLKSEDSAGSEKAFNGAELSDGICESAGTGRQARLRGVCQPTWEFKSPLSHQKYQTAFWAVWYFYRLRGRLESKSKAPAALSSASANTG